jgi:tRNA A37 threonylcarbamoyladenosine synthetase subunit TsaC/SUA5/YrdC
VRELVAAAGGPLFATSANTHGVEAPTTFSEVEARIKASASLLLDGGETRVGVASTIVVCSDDGSTHIVREGSITAADIAEALAEE